MMAGWSKLRLTLLESWRGRFLGARRHEAPLRSSTLAHRHQTPQTLTSHPFLCASLVSPLPCPCPALLLLALHILKPSPLAGFGRWPIVAAACPPPAITALVTCAGAETTAARGLEDRCRCRFEAARPLSGDTLATR